MSVTTGHIDGDLVYFGEFSLDFKEELENDKHVEVLEVEDGSFDLDSGTYWVKFRILDNPQELPKLVRNNIINDIDDDLFYEKVDGSRYLERLKEKLVEESKEFKNSGDFEEIADVLQVIDDIILHTGRSMGDIKDMKRGKKFKKGGFDEGIVLYEVREE